ncbi:MULTISPECIES: AAA family ATPase [Agrobacterium tumefaciens complex]|uniref:AAA family ATPase n=1 Tax=Agrobacterium tumefaciens complex TaxID=1183400 RepID=UPI000DDB98AA|nr:MULTISPECIES: AAA family ATPase [Agrobacterium tumefaciens complex]MBB4405309.1 2-phosphoglycerate kinase [Agrobacterium radiobacter]MBB4451283.1 2-phosphoglycerate kinase [Agrobacterium radiobacter]MDR6587730.1 2-phosphoglycerate kinase [Agrobacterium tumefaciens]
MRPTLSTILIAGTSHVGKSTLAGLLSERLRCEAISTDSLARHPGRPWPGIPAPVEEYYAQLSAETIHWFLKIHHQNIWPLIRTMIDSRSGTGAPAIFEGAALRPELISPLLGSTVAGVFLHADNDFLLDRMRSHAQYEDATADRRRIMDAFIERSLRKNTDMLASAQEHHLPVVDVTQPQAFETLLTDLAARAETPLS